MRCAVCSGKLLYDRIDDETRCLICGRAAKPLAPLRIERKRQEYPRRFTGTRDDAPDQRAS
ncbi:MAG: hypothetical protein WD359_05825 [Dehalococcoidia bacterium]